MLSRQALGKCKSWIFQIIIGRGAYNLCKFFFRNCEGSICLDDHVNMGDDAIEADLPEVGCTFKHTPLTLNAPVC